MRQACLLLWLVGCAATVPVASSAGARSAPAMEPCEGALLSSTPHVRARLQAPQCAGGRGCGHLRVCVRGVLAGVAAAATAAAAAPAAAAAAAVAAAAAATVAAAGAAAAGAAAAAAATVHGAAVLRRPRQCLRCPAASHRSRRAFGAVIGTAGHAALVFTRSAARASRSVRAMAHARPKQQPRDSLRFCCIIRCMPHMLPSCMLSYYATRDSKAASGRCRQRQPGCRAGISQPVPPLHHPRHPHRPVMGDWRPPAHSHA